jgi:predicted nucleic acid-binding protein
VTTYLDSSAWIKRYVEEAGSDLVAETVEEDPILLTCAIAEVEVRRNLERLVPDEALALRARFLEDLTLCNVAQIDADLIRIAAGIAESTLARSLDALHLATAQRVGGGRGLTFLTFDHRQARVARDLGFSVAGARID